VNPLFLIFLFLHIGAAIVAFGPTFAFPLIAAAGQKSPQHAAFAAELNDRIEAKVVLPGALSMPVSGALMIITGGIDLFQPWLLVAIVLYLIAIGYALFVQIPIGRRIVELSGGGPPPAAAAAGGQGGHAGAAPARPSGPPPELMSAVASAQRGGMFLAISIAVIVFLMVVKPF